MKDWLIRALKTFVQAVLGVFIPEIALVISGGFPADVSAWWAVLAPIIPAALAAGISAVWNIAKEKMELNKSYVPDEDDEE